MKRLSLAVAVAVFFGSAVAHAQTYTIDSSHSSVLFSVHHLVGRVAGHFDKFEGTFNYDAAKPETWQAEATIQAASVNTANDKRDAHLKTPDFFDVAKYPTLTFKSTGVTDVKDNHGKLAGNLTMHGVTKPVVLDLEIGGTIKDPWGNQRAGATATGHLNRKDFGMNWNKVLDTGGLMVGEEITIELNIEGVAK